MGEIDAHNHSTNNLKSDITYSSRSQVLRCVFVWKKKLLKLNWIEFPFFTVSLVGVLRDAVLSWGVSGIRGHFQQQAAAGDKASCLISRNSPKLPLRSLLFFAPHCHSQSGSSTFSTFTHFFNFSVFSNFMLDSPELPFHSLFFFASHCHSQSGSSRTESTALEITEECTSPPS